MILPRNLRSAEPVQGKYNEQGSSTLRWSAAEPAAHRTDLSRSRERDPTSREREPQPTAGSRGLQLLLLGGCGDLDLLVNNFYILIQYVSICRIETFYGIVVLGTSSKWILTCVILRGFTGPRILLFFFVFWGVGVGWLSHLAGRGESGLPLTFCASLQRVS